MSPFWALIGMMQDAVISESLWHLLDLSDMWYTKTFVNIGLTWEYPPWTRPRFQHQVAHRRWDNPTSDGARGLASNSSGAPEQKTWPAPPRVTWGTDDSDGLKESILHVVVHRHNCRHFANKIFFYSIFLTEKFEINQKIYRSENQSVLTTDYTR